MSDCECGRPDCVIDSWHDFDIKMNFGREKCARCGYVALGGGGRSTPEGGYVRLCHPNTEGAPDCYTLDQWERSKVMGDMPFTLQQLYNFGRDR